MVVVILYLVFFIAYMYMQIVGWGTTSDTGRERSIIVGTKIAFVKTTDITKFLDH